MAWKCNQVPSAVCICCSWDGQPWWPEARQKALDSGVLKPNDLTYRVYLLVAMERRKQLRTA